jgi:uncharacterized protein YjbI with pentapeptide repeats
MANEEHLAILKQGIEVWNKWRKDHPEILRPSLSEANLQGMNLQEVDLSGADLYMADLSRTLLNKANLSEANLNSANLNNASLIFAIVNEVDLRMATLCEADLRWADLISTRLNKAILNDANLSEANLSGADLSWSRLLRANFREANLSGADLSFAKLSEADLRGADLRGADLSWSLLNQADLSEADVIYTNFISIDLSLTKGLDHLKHHGPSSIGLDTIYRSMGEIPESFLRGIGVPNNFIEYMPSLIGNALQFYSCFISYSSKDQKFAERFHADLQSKGVRCWFAPHDVQGGKKLHEQIDQAIRIYDKLLLILSEDSMSSAWVNTEIYNARQREIKEGRQMLFPVSLAPFEQLRDWKAFDADSGKDLAREIREYYIPDFSNWKDHDSYQKEFEKLINDLKALHR